ncbi:MAG: hypothetical protein EOM73_02945 [Bacteroidia bacterium]|nr:hypothetical protein [Bacteroidia bacterium]
MKKVLFVLALVVVYGVSVSTASAKVELTDDVKVTLVADDNKVSPEGEKDKAKAKDAKAAKSEGCGTAKAEAKAEGCATAKSAGCAEKPKSDCGDKKDGGSK